MASSISSFGSLQVGLLASTRGQSRVGHVDASVSWCRLSGRELTMVASSPSSSTAESGFCSLVLASVFETPMECNPVEFGCDFVCARVDVGSTFELRHANLPVCANHASLSAPEVRGVRRHWSEVEMSVPDLYRCQCNRCVGLVPKSVKVCACLRQSVHHSTLLSFVRLYFVRQCV